MDAVLPLGGVVAGASPMGSGRRLNGAIVPAMPEETSERLPGEGKWACPCSDRLGYYSSGWRQWLGQRNKGDGPRRGIAGLRKEGGGIRGRRLGALVLLAGLLPAMAFGAPPAGRVLFAIGQARLLRQADPRDLAKGDAIQPGDRIVTKASGHVQIRMADGGFVSLRPGSVLVIQAYRFDPAHPERSRVKFKLREGVMRNVTGKAGHQNKDGFRLNTPLAALGIRGTAFTVYTSQSRTRARVHRGAITVSPFNDQCRPEGLGACSGAGAATLRAQQDGRRLLEVTTRDKAARILKGETQSLVPREAGEAESGASEGKREGPGGSGKPPGKGSGPTGPSGGGSSQTAVPNIATDVQEQETAEPVTRSVDREWQITWGRWSRFVPEGEKEGEKPALAKLTEDREIKGVNTVFALLRPQWETVDLPPTGVVRFRPGPAEAVIKEGATLTPAEVTNAHLSVDFGKRVFQTNLDITSSALTDPVSVDAAGKVRENGFLLSDPEASNSQIQGTLSPGAREAGMLFQRDLPQGRKASGAMHWLHPGE